MSSQSSGAGCCSCLQDSDRQKGTDYLKSNGIDIDKPRKPIIGVNLNRQIANRSREYFNRMAALTQYLKQIGLQVVLFPHERARWKGGRKGTINT